MSSRRANAPRTSRGAAERETGGHHISLQDTTGPRTPRRTPLLLVCPRCRRRHLRPLTARFGDALVRCATCGVQSLLADWRAAA